MNRQDFDDDDNDDDSFAEAEEATGIDRVSATFGQICCLEWEKRRERLEHPYSITGWALSVEPEVYKDCAARFTGEHRDAIEEVVRKLHLPPCPNKNPNLPDGPDRIVELFFEEFKQFRNKLAPFDKAHRWNATTALKGNSHEWH